VTGARHRMAHALPRVGEALFRARSWTAVPLAVLIAVRAQLRGKWPVWGLCVAAAGLAMRLWAVAHVGPQSRTRGQAPDTAVASGPYAHLRHPLYYANALVSEGLLVASGAGWPWLPILFPWLWLVQYGPIMIWEEEWLARTPKRAPAAPNWRAAWLSERRTRQSVVATLAAIATSVLLRRARLKRSGAISR